MIFFFSSRRRHTRLVSDWSSDVCSSDLRLDYVAPMNQEHAFCLAAEKLLGLSLPKRAQLIRVLYCEIGRFLDRKSVVVGKECRCRLCAYDLMRGMELTGVVVEDGRDEV